LIFEASEFVFKVPPAISRARRVLIKPSACYPVPYPVTTSRDILSVIIEGIRQVSDADILLLEGTPGGGAIYPIYQALGYNFPRVLMLDVKDCIWVEVDNPSDEEPEDLWWLWLLIALIIILLLIVAFLALRKKKPEEEVEEELEEEEVEEEVPPPPKKAKPRKKLSEEELDRVDLPEPDEEF